MTTAHRPTWKAAVGQENAGGYFAITAQRSALDAPAHTKLKFRKGHQIAVDDKDELVRQSLLQFEQAEMMIHKKNSLPRRPMNPVIEARAQQKLLLLQQQQQENKAEIDVKRIKEKYDDSDIEDDDDDDGDGGNNPNSNVHDDNDDDSSSSTDLDDDDSDDDDDDEDDEEALMAELAKIRAEREQAKKKEEEEAAAIETSKLEEAALFGNPLLATSTATTSGAGRLKRRWNDDVVFRHQAKHEPKQQKRFINDTVRNDFHKRFLHKFIR